MLLLVSLHILVDRTIGSALTTISDLSFKVGGARQRDDVWLLNKKTQLIDNKRCR